LICNPLIDRKSDYRKLWLNTLIYYLRNGREICITTANGIIPSLDILKNAYGWQTECVKFIGEVGHQSVNDHFFAATMRDLCDTRDSVSCFIADIPRQDQLHTLAPLFKRFKTILILEELCDQSELGAFMDFVRTEGVKPIIVTSRLLGVDNHATVVDEIIRVLPYRYVDDLRDCFPISTSLCQAKDLKYKVNEVGEVDGIPQYLHQYQHVFRQMPCPIYPHIAIDENTLINSFSLVLLLRVFGVEFELVGSTSSITAKSFYLRRFLTEDPCYLFSRMNHNDAGWCNVWQKTQD
jgi:hypothetical protein